MTITHPPHSGTDPFVQASQRFLPLLDLLAEARCRRRLSRDYSRMTEYQLSDIGLTRQDIAAAFALPLEHSATEVLACIAAKEAARW